MLANNSTWELLDGRTLDTDAADELLGRAYAAAHHWRRAEGATTVNAARASWLLSRAHAVLGHGDLALHHAEQCGRFTDGAGAEATDFDHAYRLEATARALACLGRTEAALEARERAAAVAITDEQDRSIFEADLAAEPWFGIDG